MAQRMDLLPRSQQKLTFTPFNLAHPILEDDPNFDLRNHIKFHSLPKGTGESAFVHAAMAAFEPRLDRDEQMWEIHLFRGLAGKRSGLLWKVHHCLLDGVSVIELLKVALDLHAEARASAPPDQVWAPMPLSSPFRIFSDAVADLLKNRLNYLRK
jgi:diacylglycerol O-acyltransferase / wax synthase